ncbi:hypothetical protein M2103_001113 [Ereboglobus sp. PH5-5]|uniref:DUF3568 family protein n=1 Tax=unclassified Ereboglobus TaxID=2626932 RepID=UPI002405D91E|nr:MULTISPECIES: DUF3568 family protein [unclassified Ereboglobus]MDF9828149.1 hypothetical protein [Ereboglobus sp. PH5-10]MDF9832899.1 hypothetical protein [Ereboglobus sp. PH5-5]
MLKHTIATLLIAACLAFVAGCQNIPLGGENNVGAFNFGEFEGLYNTTAPTVTQTAREAAQQLGLTEVALTEGKFESTIIARDANDLKVQIKVSEANSLQTKIRIRWGTGGDRDQSIKFYNTVEKLLASK